MRHLSLEFQVGDKILLCLQPYQQLYLANQRHKKLLAKFYGPFTITQHIGSMAYKLELSADSRLHPPLCFMCPI